MNCKGVRGIISNLERVCPGERTDDLSKEESNILPGILSVLLPCYQTALIIFRRHVEERHKPDVELCEK